MKKRPGINHFLKKLTSLTCLGIGPVAILGQVREGYEHPFAPNTTTSKLLDPGFRSEDRVRIEDAEIGIYRSRQGEVSTGNGQVSSGYASLVSGPRGRQKYRDVIELGLGDVVETF